MFFNTDIKDEDKASVVADIFRTDGLPSFSYILLPNDHTNGLSPGSLTPEAMISDNDYGVGLLVDAISHLPEWESTAIFIVQDDTQGTADHVDLHRSILLVASPWARHGETSHVHTSYPSLFRTFEHILGLPPLNRYDAAATPLYDSFTDHPDFRPFQVRARRVPDAMNGSTHRTARGIDVATRWSERMDFSAPDASPELGDVLWLARRGEAPRGSRLARVIAGEIPDEGPTEDGDGDDDAYDEAMERFRALAENHPSWRARIRSARDDDD